MARREDMGTAVKKNVGIAIIYHSFVMVYNPIIVMTGGWFFTGERDLQLIRQETAGFANNLSPHWGKKGPQKSGDH